MSNVLTQHASASRFIADLGALLPSLSVLAIVAGGFWFVVSLTISPIKDDVNELKALELKSELAKINLTLQNIKGRLDTIDGKLVPHTHPVDLLEWPLIGPEGMEPVSNPVMAET